MFESVKVIQLFCSIFRGLKKKAIFYQQLFCEMDDLIYVNHFLGFFAFSIPLKDFIQVIWTYVIEKFESGRMIL